MPVNKSLQALHRELISLAADLARAQETAETIEAVRALGNEHTEVTSRVIIVGNLLFRAETDAIDTAMAAVEAGKAKVETAIKKIEKLNAFLKAISSFLGLVDKVIDTAKLI